MNYFQIIDSQKCSQMRRGSIYYSGVLRAFFLMHNTERVNQLTRLPQSDTIPKIS